MEIVEGHFTRKSLLKLNRDRLEELAGDLGVDVRECKNKGEIAELLAAVEVDPSTDGENPPALGATPPVV